MVNFSLYSYRTIAIEGVLIDKCRQINQYYISVLQEKARRSRWNRDSTATNYQTTCCRQSRRIKETCSWISTKI